MERDERPLRIGGLEIQPGQRRTINLPVARLYTHAQLTMPVRVVSGTNPGPRLFVSAAVHGDEINGVEIIRRLLRLRLLKRLSGTLIAVPVVNVYGFIGQSRYLPDRRDLNRAFPGSDKGSLAAQLACLFMSQVVANCTHGIDLHTGAVHRDNLPHIRASLDDPESFRLAIAFGSSIVLNSDLRDGSLREAVKDHGIPVLLYEAGEALRFDEVGIRTGVKGIVSVMRAIGMLPERVSRERTERPLPSPPFISRSSTWVRAPLSGILRTRSALGRRISKKGVLGIVADPFGKNETKVRSHAEGMIIGVIKVPLVNQGEALFHIAQIEEDILASKPGRESPDLPEGPDP